jgi:hypothetical protein
MRQIDLDNLGEIDELLNDFAQEFFTEINGG